MKANNNSAQILNILVELSKAGAKGGDVAGCISALRLRSGNAKVVFKQEDVLLACSYVKAGCSVAEIHAMFELLTGQHKNKELQTFYNANQNYRGNPTELKELMKGLIDCPQLNSQLATTNPQLI